MTHTFDVPPVDPNSTLTWEGIYAAIETLGLERNLADLQRDGITTITPEQSGITPELTARVRDRLIELFERITGVCFSLEEGPSEPVAKARQDHLTMVSQLLGYDIPEFVDVLFNPAMQTMVAAVLGPTRRLSSHSGFLKWATPLPDGQTRHEPYFLHTDSAGVVGHVPNDPPFVCNTNFLLTDYGCWEDGPMVIAPGSHRDQRQPLPSDAERMVGSYAPAGSFFVFGGALIHGSVRRSKPGLRVSINSYFCQPYIAPQEHLERQLPKISALGPLAKQLVWDTAFGGFGKNGPPSLPTPYRGDPPEEDYGLMDPEEYGPHRTR